MDRELEKKKGLKAVFRKKNIPYLAGAMFLVFVLWLIFRDNSSAYRADKDMLNIVEVRQDQFHDYIRLNGQVQPITTIQVTPLEGGIVEEIRLEEGSQVKRGDVIAVLSNNNLTLSILDSEAQLAEKENILRNTMISMEQQKLELQRERNEFSMQVNRNRRLFEQNDKLYREGLISHEEWLKSKEDYELSLSQKTLIEERQIQDSLYRSVEIEQLENSLESMRRNMELIRQRIDNLNIKANIDGELGLLDLVLGQSVATGEKIGQINDLSNYKIVAQIDEHYIDRVINGLSATFERQGVTYNAQVRKVYPEVREGKFQADFKLVGERPDNIRTGQTYYLNLELGQPEEAIIISKGTFFQKTGGAWIYVLTEDGTQAVRREIRIGRQNPQYYEVLEGLEPGEKVVVSGYDSFGDAERLIF
ncbi:MAG: HlyD family efflux transporter periplasmic adaptor subunit [Muribaculum sp.]|uniref:HlyD family efflux transporter periplasmic adaptor subunit n=1 Tax=Candidatus Merdivivens faecigallinarum TaxID=2840871 RepID=A0A9D9NPS0_9BACT|nr:HlyD family efflux transporter periplasmic adaptor subunit [Candidatus Merdivivens faecigallinarum]